MSRIIWMLVTIAGTLGVVATDTAGPPAIVPVDVDGLPDSTCSDFGIDLEFGLHGTLVIISTGSGTEIQAAPNFTISWTANGKTLTSRGPAPLLITYDAQGYILQTKVPGLLVAVTIPGEGIVFLDTGLLVFDGPFLEGPISVMRGPHQIATGEGLEAFCAYFED